MLYLNNSTSHSFIWGGIGTIVDNRSPGSGIHWVSMHVNKSEIYIFNICVPFFKLSDDNCSIEQISQISAY